MINKLVKTECETWYALWYMLWLNRMEQITRELLLDLPARQLEQPVLPREDKLRHKDLIIAFKKPGENCIDNVALHLDFSFTFHIRLSRASHQLIQPHNLQPPQSSREAKKGQLLSRLPPSTLPRHSKPYRTVIVLHVPPSQGRPIPCHIQPASRGDTRRNSVNVLDASTLDSENVAVRHGLIRDGAVKPGEPHKQVHGPVLLIDNVAAVGDLDVGRHAADGAGLPARVALAGVGAALEPGACRAPGDLDADVVEAVKVGVAAGLDHGARVLLIHGDGVPVLDGVPVEVPRGVEEPVARVGHDRLHVRDLAVVGVEYPRADDVRVVRVGHDELCKGCTLDCVVDAAVVVDVQGLGQDAGPGVRGRAIFHVLEYYKSVIAVDTT